MSWSRFEYRPYVSVAERQRNAQRELAKFAKKGLVVRPIKVEGRTIAESFWGKAWCDNLESYMDYANRLPRGRTYVRNGSVVHLNVGSGVIEAMVCGSELYTVKIQIVPAHKAKWKALCQSCAGGIGSLVELLQGRLSDHVMQIITARGTGLFPSPAEIKMDCSCPDSAGMCKHIAAVLYGVGARLDQSPDLLFLLRSVNHEELIQHATAATDLAAKASAPGPELTDSELSAVFGIELDDHAGPAAPPPAPLAEAPVSPNAPMGPAPLQGSSRSPQGRCRKANEKDERRSPRADRGSSESKMGPAPSRISSEQA